MKTDKLSLYLEYLVKEYANKTDAVSFESVNGDADSKHQIVYDKLKYEFVYSKKSSETYPISTLYCRVYLNKESGFFFEIPEIITYLELLDYHSYHFAFIENKTRMKACFDYFTDFLEFRNKEIESLIPRFDELREIKKEEIVRVYGFDVSAAGEDEDEFYNKLDEYASEYSARRFTTGKAFSAYIHGDFEKALKEYEKEDELLASEKRIIEFIDGKLEPYQAMPEECASILEIEKYKSKSFKLFLMMLGVSIAFFFILFFIIQTIINVHTARVTEFCDTISPFKTALIGIITGTLFALAFRDRIEPFLLNNNIEAYDFGDLLSEQKFFSPIRIIFIVVLAVSVIAFADFSRPTLMLYKDKIMYNSHARGLNNYAEYRLEDFYDVVEVKGRYINNYKHYIEDPYYVLEFSNGQYINLEKLSLSKKRKEKLIKTIRHNRESDIPNVRSIEDL